MWTLYFIGFVFLETSFSLLSDGCVVTVYIFVVIMSWIKMRWDEKFWNAEHDLYVKELDVAILLESCGMNSEKLFTSTLSRKDVEEAVEELSKVQQMVVLKGNLKEEVKPQEFKQRGAYDLVHTGVMKGESVFYKALKGTEMKSEDLASAKVALDDFKKESKLSRKAKAKAIMADESLRQAAMLDLRMSTLAPRSAKAYSSEVELYIDMVKGAGIEPWPVSPMSIRTFAAGLKSAGYVSGNIYLSAVMTCARAKGLPISEEAKCERTLCGAAFARGTGDTNQMLPVTTEMLEEIRQWLKKNSMKDFGVMVLRLQVVALFFMLRADEVINIRLRDVVKASGRNGVAELTIAAGKTNQAGKTLRRKLACVCGDGANEQVDGLEICPSCALFNLVVTARASNPDPTCLDRHISCGVKNKPLAYDGFLKEMRAQLSAIGVQTFGSNGKGRYGTHSLRRGGAQALARSKWPLATIQLWGRWESNTVMEYVQDTVFDESWKDVATAMVGLPAVKEEVDEPEVKTVVKTRRAHGKVKAVKRSVGKRTS